MGNQIEILSKLFRDLEAEIGTRDLSIMVLKALMASVESVKFKEFEEFFAELKKLYKVVSETEPKFGILNYHFALLITDIECTIKNDPKNRPKWRRLILKKIKKKIKEGKEFKCQILSEAENINVEGKTILIHDHSHTVQDVLAHFKKLGRHFRVVIAEQDFEKSHDNIERMHTLRIPFEVVPSYMLSHIHKEIDMLFFGALTLKDTMDFVMDPGTHGIISEFHLESIPSYMFINANKFSLWKSKKKGEVFMRRHSYQHCNKPIEYDKVKYSHDRVPSKLFHKIVTNEGMMTPDGVEKLYKKKYAEYQKICH